MRCTVIQLTDQTQTSNVEQRIEHDLPYISIGRGADQTIQLSDLRIALHHARISLRDNGKLQVEAKTIIGVRVNGKLLKQSNLQPGDYIELSEYRITIAEAEKNSDAQLIVETIPSHELKGKSAYALPNSIADLGISKRKYSWSLFGIIFIAFFALPMANYFFDPQTDWLKDSLLPSDNAWSTGPLDSAHSRFGETCTSCHQSPFQKVPMDACLQCHSNITAHLSDASKASFPLEGGHSNSITDTLTNTLTTTLFEFEDCSQCHKEHQGHQGMDIIPNAQCTDCHEDLPPPSEQSVAIDPFNDFDSQHPQFKVTTQKYVASLNRTLAVSVALDDPYLQETSNLKFPHDVHLDKSGIRGPKGDEILQCENCHEMEPGGGKMKKITMQGQCQHCHRLYFEPGVLRELPHADVEAVRYTLREFYANEALIGNIKDEASLSQLRRRRRNNQPTTEVDITQANQWARQKEQSVALEIFENRLCVSCHEILKQADYEWRILPVNTINQWFTNSKFEHIDHQTEQCDSCHEANTSTLSNDVLIPDIKNCRQCHSDSSDDQKIETPCLNCHVFHKTNARYRPETPQQSIP